MTSVSGTPQGAPHPIPSAGMQQVAASPFPTGLFPDPLVTGDFNGDGKLDLATSNSNDDTVTVLLGNGDGTFTPASIPIDGYTITVFIDNQPIEHPVYNNARSDIQTLFPGYANTNDAVGYFYINTTLSNGLHQIAWSVLDSAGHKTGIGSRYFTVQN